MAVRWLSVVRSLLVLANWLCFIAVFIWTSSVQGRADWWLSLNWGTWLTDLQSTIYLREVAVGSVWILWLLISVLISLIWIVDRVLKPAHTVQDDIGAVHDDDHGSQSMSADEECTESPEPLEPEVVDEVRLKILKLQETLKQI